MLSSTDSSRKSSEILTRAFSKLVKNQEEILNSNKKISVMERYLVNIEDILESKLLPKENYELTFEKTLQQLNTNIRELHYTQKSINKSIDKLENAIKELNILVKDQSCSNQFNYTKKSKIDKEFTSDYINTNTRKNEPQKNSKKSKSIVFKLGSKHQDIKKLEDVFYGFSGDVQSKIVNKIKLILKLKIITDFSADTDNNKDNDLSYNLVWNIIKLINKLNNFFLSNTQAENFGALSVGNISDYQWINEVEKICDEIPNKKVNKEHLSQFHSFFNSFCQDFAFLNTK